MMIQIFLYNFQKVSTAQNYSADSRFAAMVSLSGGFWFPIVIFWLTKKEKSTECRETGKVSKFWFLLCSISCSYCN